MVARNRLKLLLPLFQHSTNRPVGLCPRAGWAALVSSMANIQAFTCKTQVYLSSTQSEHHITQIFSASCLVLSLSLGVYSVSDTDCPKKTIGCLISNYCEVINKSSGFGIAKIILIILGIIFLPNYNNNSITKMIEESYGIPKTIFISIVMLFIVVYTLIPGYSLLKGLEGHKDEAANNFYDKARCIGD